MVKAAEPLSIGIGEAQIRDLKAAGAEKLFSENVSSVAPRKQLEVAIEFARKTTSHQFPRGEAPL
jgi:hypothetical protein